MPDDDFEAFYKAHALSSAIANAALAFLREITPDAGDPLVEWPPLVRFREAIKQASEDYKPQVRPKLTVVR